MVIGFSAVVDNISYFALYGMGLGEGRADTFSMYVVYAFRGGTLFKYREDGLRCVRVHEYEG